MPAWLNDIPATSRMAYQLLCSSGKLESGKVRVYAFCCQVCFLGANWSGWDDDGSWRQKLRPGMVSQNDVCRRFNTPTVDDQKYVTWLHQEGMLELVGVFPDPDSGIMNRYWRPSTQTFPGQKKPSTRKTLAQMTSTGRELLTTIPTTNPLWMSLYEIFYGVNVRKLVTIEPGDSNHAYVQAHAHAQAAAVPENQDYFGDGDADD